MEVQTFDIVFFDLLDIAFVIHGEDQVGHPVAFGGEDLFLYAADGQHASSEGDLAGHGQLSLHFTLGEGRGQGGQHGDSRRGAVFGCRAFGHMNMDIPSIENIRVDVQQ